MEIFSYQAKGLALLGLGRAPEKKLHRVLLVAYRGFLWIYLLYFLVMYAIFIAENYDDIIETVLVVSSLGIDVISVVKLFTLWLYLDRFYAVMEKIQENADTLQTESIARANKIGRIFSKIFFYQLITAISLYNVMPIVLNTFNYFTYGSEWTPDMPLKFKSYIDVRYSPAYELTYIANVLDINLISASNFVVDSLFLIACLNVGAVFEHLRSEVHVRDKKDFMAQHREILALAKELNAIFRPIVFVEFLVIAFVFCGIGLVFVMAQSVVERFMLVCYGNVMMIQLLIYCYSGQYLLDRAVSVCDEVYTLDIDYKIIIMRTQRRVRIEAPFFHATLEQYGSVLNTAWALISVLKSSMRQ